MHKILAAEELLPARTSRGAWNPNSLAELNRGLRDITGREYDRVIIAPSGYFIVDRDQPQEPRVAAFLRIPRGLQQGVDRDEWVAVVSHNPFNLPKVDSFICSVRIKAELEWFWDHAPIVRITQNMIVFMLHPKLGMSVSHSGSGHAHTRLALRFVHRTLFSHIQGPPEDYPHLPRGRIHPHLTMPPTIAFSTERDPQVDPNYRTFLNRIKTALRALRKLGLSEDSIVKYQGEDRSSAQSTMRKLLAQGS